MNSFLGIKQSVSPTSRSVPQLPRNRASSHSVDQFSHSLPPAMQEESKLAAYASLVAGGVGVSCLGTHLFQSATSTAAQAGGYGLLGLGAVCLSPLVLDVGRVVVPIAWEVTKDVAWGVRGLADLLFHTES